MIPIALRAKGGFLSCSWLHVVRARYKEPLQADELDQYTGGVRHTCLPSDLALIGCTSAEPMSFLTDGAKVRNIFLFLYENIFSHNHIIT